MSSESYQRNVNLWAGRIVPCVLIGITGYSIWVVMYLVCVQYLLSPQIHYQGYEVPKRNGTAITILVLYFLLLPPYLISYLRILQLVVTNPGYIAQRPANPQDTVTTQEKKQTLKWACLRTTIEENARSERQRQPGARNNVEPGGSLDRVAILNGSVVPPPGIDQFYSKDVFVCDQNGLPIFCDKCNNWKPDRTHHCSEVGRCVRRMDHFCPWVGGVVSETTMKFFIQFTFYGTLFCAFVFGVMIWAVVDRRHRTHQVDGNWIAIIAAGGLFAFIAVGMFGNTVHQSIKNLTTIELLGRVYFMAVLLPSESAPQSNNSGMRYGVITYPLPRQPLFDEARRDIGREESHVGSGSRTFAIIASKPGDNPWSTTPLENLKTVLGERFIDWVLPWKFPPSCFHDRGDSDFTLGPDFERMKRDHGLPSSYQRKHGSKRRRRHSRGSRHSTR